MLNRHRNALAVAFAAIFTACTAFLPPAPILPARFEGPLSAIADSLVAEEAPSRCAAVRHVDFGTTPQGCLRRGDNPGWVNWKDAGVVVKVGREWLQPDVTAALEAARSMESELAGRLGSPVECHYKYQWTTREVRWIAADKTGVSTALIVWDTDRIHSATPRVILIRSLGPERCGNHNDRPFAH